MNFEDWYNSYKMAGLDKRSAEQVWDACKRECIKLVRQPFQTMDVFDGQGKNASYLADKLEKEI